MVIHKPIDSRTGIYMAPTPAEVRSADSSAPVSPSTRARRAMRPELARAAAASWKHDEKGLRYLAGR